MAPTPDPKDPLLTNALEAIENGMEDFAGGNPRRMSSALRNLSAGVLLLLKEKLRRESPPGSNGVLIYKRLVPSKAAGHVTFTGKGKATIDADEIRERLEALDVSVNWKRVFALRDLRNAVEHHQATVPHVQMQQAIADTFIVVVEIFEQLGLTPANELSPGTWARMLQETDTFNALQKACSDSKKLVTDIPEVAEETFREWAACPGCESELLKAHVTASGDAKFTCQACAAVSDLSAVMATALENKYAGEAYSAAKQGCESPVALCPTCGADAFVLESDACYVCGEGRQHQECPRCGNEVSVEEQELNGLCGYCYHVMSNDD